MSVERVNKWVLTPVPHSKSEAESSGVEGAIWGSLEVGGQSQGGPQGSASVVLPWPLGEAQAVHLGRGPS